MAGDRAVRLFVLVVDDEDIVRASLRRLLEAAGDVAVATATDAASAEAALRANRFDGVVTDLAFGPDAADARSGLEVLDLVRRLDDGRGDGLTELVLITGTNDIVAANRAEELGARFLHKPFDPSAVARFLDRVRGKARVAEVAVEEAARLADRARLPARVRQVFLLIVARQSTQEICAWLRISEDTLKTYVKTLIRELRHVAGIEAKDRRDITLAVWSRVVPVQRALSFRAAAPAHE